MRFDLLKYLQSKPVVTKAEVKKYLSGTDAYATLTLQRLVKRGLLTHIARGKYTANTNALLVASHLTRPSYISFLAASQFYGYTTQLPKQIVVMATHHQTVHFAGQSIILLKKEKELFGYTKITTNDGELFIAEPEKLLIDCLRHQEHIGNFEETLNILKNAPLNKEKLILYLQHQPTSVIKRAGFLLETLQGIKINLPIDANYTPLELNKKGKHKDTKWRITHDLKI